ncbi:hypothetical protein RFI_06344 [Reticulomyxa filosa]|uniref:Uncharacterized protein n=1 Tax=Reticulomyxa filosa TaxID=46433 RepID=X6NXR5_RETFI|nr:hypothetical protein RFI_06344 [Reticulomyxa filosa]|eukprot:ETO30776.1 hypothetical protein RFI_06344 [Reticulomyxa filosa]
MKFSLMLAAIHVLVVSIANAFSSSKNVTNGQTYSSHYNNICTFAISLNTLISYYINYVWTQCLPSYNLTILSCVQIFNKGLMVLENESIRFPPSTLLINSKFCDNNSYIKTAIDMFKTTSGTSSTFFKFTFKAISYSIVLAARDVEVILRTLPSNGEYVLSQQSELIIGLKTSYVINHYIHNVDLNTGLKDQHQCQICFSGVSMSSANNIQIQIRAKSDVKSEIPSTPTTSKAILQC